MSRYLLNCFFILSISFVACDDGIIIGEDLLDDEEIGTGATENFDIKAITTIADPIYPFLKGEDRQTYMTGEIIDPVFGRYSSDIYIANILSATPDFFDATADSVVLVLQYDTLGLYGDTLATHDLMVYRIEENFIDRDSIESSETLMTGALLGSKSFVPAPLDSVTIVNTSGNNQGLVPQLRIPLDLSFAAELLADSSLVMGDEELQEALKGLYITARSNGQSMLGFRMDSGAFGSLNLYYTQNDDQKVFSFPFAADVFAHIEHDYAGYPVESFIDDEIGGDSLLFIQSLRGLDTELLLPDLSEFTNDRLVNKATLTFTVAELDSDFPLDLFPLDRQLEAYSIDDSGEKSRIRDISKFGDDISSGLQVFNGRSTQVDVDGETLIQYQMNITDFIREASKSGDSETRLILAPILREESPRNVVLYGPGHSKYPAKLRIVYTDL